METDNSTSGFIFSGNPDTDKIFTDRTEISSSGFNRVVKAKRYGKWYLINPSVINFPPTYLYQHFYC